jgi:hypothetical protein
MTESQQGGGAPQIGSKLQLLIDNDCITKESSGALSQQQLGAIEALSYAEIGAMIDVRKAVGPVMSGRLI